MKLDEKFMAEVCDLLEKHLKTKGDFAIFMVIADRESGDFLGAGNIQLDAAKKAVLSLAGELDTRMPSIVS